MHDGTPAHSCGHTSSERPREPKSALQTHISFRAHPQQGHHGCALQQGWQADGAGSWPQTTATAEDVLFGPLLQVKQEKTAEKHNQKEQIQMPTRGSPQHHTLIWLFFIDSDKRNL